MIPATAATDKGMTSLLPVLESLLRGCMDQGVDGVAPLGGACEETSMERKRLQAYGCMVADKPPSNPMQPFTMRLSPRILQWIDAQREEEESRASVVRRALIAAMKREQELQRRIEAARAE